MDAEQRQAHWQGAYESKGEHGVSWFQDTPEPSLSLILAAAKSATSAIIDVGGGASRVVDHLLRRGYCDLSVLDISPAALTAAQARLGRDAERIHWLTADITTWTPARRYDVWHDRAALHFMVEEADRAAYLTRLMQGLAPGGYAIIATFAPDGPEKCSGLPVQRYDADSLRRVLGPTFTLTGTQRHLHNTPWGSVQAFQFSVFRRST
jgi:SAM-dependent methyltransferase